MSNLILFGFKSCGKTYWGKRLAEELKVPFIDTDRRLEELYTQEYGEQLTCSEIHKKRGDPVFRHFEKLAVVSLANTQGSVIALGGGAVLPLENRALLHSIGRLIYLKVDPETLKARIQAQANPPFFGDAFDTLYAERSPLYEQVPAYVLSLDHKSETEILNRLKEIPYGQ